MDLYGNQRNWKELAYWNNLEKPFALKKGQVLFLSTPPKKNVAEENLVHGIKEPEQKDLKGRASVKQQFEKTNEGYIYIVNERAPWLWMVARDLYGNPKMADQIAQWNNLGTAAKIHLGQKLKLETAPTITAEEGTAILVKHWSSLGNDEMVARLSEGSLVKNEPVIKELSTTQEAVAVIQKKLEKLEKKQATIETRVEKLEVVTKSAPMAQQEKPLPENHSAKTEEKPVTNESAKSQTKEKPVAALPGKSETKEATQATAPTKIEGHEKEPAAMPSQAEEKVAAAKASGHEKNVSAKKSKKAATDLSASGEKEKVAEEEAPEQKTVSESHNKKSAKKAKSHEAVEDEEETSEVANHVKAAKSSKSLSKVSTTVAVPCCMREPASPDNSNPGKEPKSPEYWLGPYSQQIIDKIDKKLKTKEK